MSTSSMKAVSASRESGLEMTHSHRAFLLLVVVQTVCLALGLWLHGRFASSLSEWNSAGAATSRGEEIAGAASVGSSSHVATEAGTSGGDSSIAVRVLAFVWIGGLQALAAYLVLTRVQTERSREDIRSMQKSLLRHKELLRTRDAVIFGLAKLAESRDADTGYHLERIAFYSTRLASAVRRDPHYRRQVTHSFVKLIGISSALHDIGKVGVEDAILRKPGALAQDERSRMELHAEMGGDCIREIELRLGSSNFLQMAREIAYCHHERWDGEGYPKGLAGDAIPLAARIVAVVDTYDALSTKRVYKERFPHAECVEAIAKEAGKRFDPRIVAAFLKVESEFERIAQRSVDPGQAQGWEPPWDPDLPRPASLLEGCVGRAITATAQTDASVPEPDARPT